MKSKPFAFLLILGLLISLAPAAFAADERVFELRTYTTEEGRLEALQSRFRDHTLRIFAKHGMEVVGFWVPTDVPNTLIYVMAYPSVEARAAAWKAFGADPEWQKVAADSQKDGQILVKGGVKSVIMTPTDYSPIR